MDNYYLQNHLWIVSFGTLLVKEAFLVTKSLSMKETHLRSPLRLVGSFQEIRV